MMKRILSQETKNEIYFGDNFYDDVKSLLLQQNIKDCNIALMTGKKSFMASDFGYQMNALIRELNNQVVYSHKIASNPRKEEIDNTIKELEGLTVDYIIAIGGGSVVDYAKGCKMGLSSPLNIFCIYTNTGSGAIASPFVVYDNHEFKIGDHSEDAMPQMAYINKDIIASTPSLIVGSGLCDMYCHAVEAYLSTTATNESRAFSLLALANIREFLAKHTIKNLVLADLYAILSESVGIVLLPHALGHEITYTHKISHGYASIAFMRSFLLHLKKAGTEVPEEFHTILNEITTEFGNPLPLGIAPKIPQARLDLIDRYMGFAIHNSPAVITRKDIEHIYAESMSQGVYL